MSLLSLLMTVLLQSTGISAASEAFEQRFEAPAPVRVAPAPQPKPVPRDRLCGAPPRMGTCAGAIGFCPVYRCIEGEWVDVRPSKKGRPGDPLSY